MYETKPYFYGTGRRKSSVARVRVYNGTGKITINNRDIDDYFGLETLKLIVNQPLEITDTVGKFDIVCNVTGGGVTRQAGAIRHGLSRALLQYNEELRPALKKAGLLTIIGSEIDDALRKFCIHLDLCDVILKSLHSAVGHHVQR